MTAYIVAGCNERYHARFQACAASLAAHSNLPYRLLSVGYDGGAGYTPLTHEQNWGAPDETQCIQHGSFLAAVPGDPDDVLIYLDGDVTMQRPFDDGELDWLDRFPVDAVAAAWNREGETLAEELQALGLKKSMGEMAALWGDVIYTAPQLNAGVVVARRSTWERSYALYLEKWPLAGESMHHMARQQWLMCWTYAALGLYVQTLPWSIHAHGHFGFKPGMERRGDGIYVDGKLAVFRHFC